MNFSLTLDLGSHETPSDFASRLSMRSHRDDMREFCRDFGIDPRGIINGEQEAVAALAKLAGANTKTLQHEAFVRLDGATRHFRHKGQLFLQSSLMRNRVRMCPACMLEDIERLDCRVAARPHRRSMWLIRGVRTCPKHGIALAQIGKLDAPGAIHDTSRVIADTIPRLGALSGGAISRKPSRFEHYLLRRLRDAAIDSWLDGLPIYAAMHLSFVAGAVAVHGPGVTLDDLDDAEAWRCEATGFGIVDKGPEGIRAFLDDLQAPFRDSRSAKGPKVMYGRLYDWLAHECRDKAYDPVRDIIIDHSVDTLALGADDILFGRKVGVRRKHSVVSAAKEFGLHPKRMRKMLQRANLTDIGADAPADNKVTFDAAEAEALLKGLAESMSMERAREYLNVPRPHDRGLLERGFITPMMAGGRAQGGHAFLKSDLDGFLERLLRNADPSLQSDTGLVPLIAAARHSCSAVMDVVALVLDGKLSRVGRDTGQAGFLSILVDAEEVRPLVTGPDYDGHSMRDLERLLPAKSRAVKALVDQGFIAVDLVKNPVTKWMQPIVRREELARFKREFVSLHALSQERGDHFSRVKKALVAAGVKPVADPDLLGQTLYRRSDIP